MMPKKKEVTTITMDIETRERLDKHGKYGDSMSDILNRLMDKVENK